LTVPGGVGIEFHMDACRQNPGHAVSVALGALLAVASATACGPVDDGVASDGGGRSGGDSAAPGDAGPQDAGARTSLQGFACAEVEAELTCGGMQCSDLGSAGSDFCAVNCCTEEGRCGARVAVIGRPAGGCIEQAQPDGRCPALEGELGTVEGCCTRDNECGVLFGPMCTPLRNLRGPLSAGDQDLQPTDCDGNPLPDLDGHDDVDAGL